MITEQDLEVIAKHVIDAFQKGKFKAMLPPIRAEINTLKSVGTGYSLVDGKQGEVLTVLGLLPGNFIDMKVVGRDIVISLKNIPKLESVHIENIRGVSIKDPKEGDILVFMDKSWKHATIDDFETIKALKLTRSYPEEDQRKLSEIQNGAQVNPGAAEIKNLYESNQDTNPFTNRDKVLLQDAQVKSHSHKNRELLDEYTVKNEEIAKAAESAHIHPNVDVLNKITNHGSGKIITVDERAALADFMAYWTEIKALLKTKN